MKRSSQQFLTFIRKEFTHVLRDRKTLLILFGLPIVQIIIFGFALSNEVKNSRLLLVDYAKDDASRAIIARLGASKYFDLTEAHASSADIEETFKAGKAQLAVVFPSGFEEDLLHFNRASLQVIADASDPNTANTLTNYLTSIVLDYQDGEQPDHTTAHPSGLENIRTEEHLHNVETQNLARPNVPIRYGQASLHYASPRPQIGTQVRMLYNPQLKGAHNFVPGVMALVLMLVCVMMTAVSIVREKELGTMEILLVSPFKPELVILSKAVPYLILSLINVTTILLLSIFVLDLPVKGSVPLLFAESTLFIITSLSLGLFISVRAETQQTAMLVSMMGMLLPTLLFSGFMFPIENMPKILQYISNVVPAKWYYLIVQSIMIKGLGFEAIWEETLILLAISVGFLIVSFKKFKIRLA